MAVAGVLLSGCGAINNAINARIQPAVNPVGLDNQAVDVVLSGGGGVVTGSGEREVTFEDRTLSEAGRLRFVRFNQSFQNSVAVNAPAGTALPAEFSLSKLTLVLAFRDGAPRAVSVEKTIDGPVTFVRAGETNEYRTNGSLVFSDLEIRTNFGTLRDIFTDAPTPNAAGITVRLESSSAPLPAGTVVRFTSTGSTAQFGV